MNRPFESLEGIWSGIPLFTDSRVPVYFFIDFLENDDDLDEFLYAYQTVDPADVEMFLRLPLPPQLRYAKSPV